ncbi:hypothetical protein [Phycicoccus sonneratiae]|uniref:DNA-directed RNA polymerase specialized sigma24 family protein n=1 Tax=Phycicoccus sonneratiae TaxID=2807628 RepID=A0ABS2CNP3_9MICO|nr:hypothetical protein [Phycicoccus sonneraticus]MBM6401506.1 hypothetical protein [Phycicoccus sonneraticus]
MTPPSAPGFRDFAEARWPDLEAVALVTTLDPVGARSATARALAALAGRWGTVVEEGRPTAEAQTALLALLARPLPASPDPVAVRAVLDGPGDHVPLALLDRVLAEEPAVRADLAAEAVWAWAPGAGARALGLPDADPALAGARARLVEAHRAARAADGLAPADEEVVADLCGLADRLAAAQPPAPDPDSLAAAVGPGARRRLLVAGGGTALAVGALAWWGTAGRGARSTAATSGPPPNADRTWTSTARWPARGRVGTDLEVQALVARSAPGGRVLLADDVLDGRVVVAAEAAGEASGTTLRLWTGPVGAAPTGLAEVPLVPGQVRGAADVVALGVPHGDAGVLVVLTGPGVERARYSLVARPTPLGGIRREWEDLPLTGGIGSVLLGQPAGPAARVRVGGWDGPLPRPRSWARVGRRGEDAFRDEVAAITGVPADRLRLGVRRSRLPDDLVLPTAPDSHLEARLLVATTPDGAVLRALLVTTADAAPRVVRGDGPLVVPADDAEAPFALRVDDDLGGRSTWVVTSPPRGATVQFRTADGTDRALGAAAPVVGHAAVVRVELAPGAAGARVVVRDADGTLVVDGPPLRGRDAYDLAPGDPA